MDLAIDRTEYNRRRRVTRRAEVMLANAHEHLTARGARDAQAATTDAAEVRTWAEYEAALKVIDTAIRQVTAEGRDDRKAAGVGTYTPYGRLRHRSRW